jgi:hypothetical protein
MIHQAHRSSGQMRVRMELGGRREEGEKEVSGGVQTGIGGCSRQQTL